MEDPGEEWEIEIYSPSQENNGTVSWIFKEALGLGKKVVITGIVVSSAPLVLPLVCASVVGFVFWAPAGLVLASYACTEKLMSKLLPMPEPPLMLDCTTEEEEKEGYGGEVGMEAEEREEMDDIKEGPEKRIELVKGKHKDAQKGIVLEEKADQELEDIEKNKRGMVDEEDYEENVDEYLDGESREPLGELDVKIEGEAGKEEKEEKEIAMGKNEKPQVVKGRIEDVKDEGETEAWTEEKKEPIEGVDVKIEGPREEEEKEPQVKEIEEPLEGVDMKIEVVSEDGVGETPVKENKEQLEREVVETEGVVEIGVTMDDNKIEQPVAEEQRIVAVAEGNGGHSGNIKEEKLVILVAREVKGETRDERKMIGGEVEELKRGTTGLLLKIRDEGDMENAAKLDYHIVLEKDEKNVMGTEEIEKPVDESNKNMENVVEDIKQTGGRERNETILIENEGSTDDIEKPLEDQNVREEKLGRDMDWTVEEMSDDQGSAVDIEKPYDDRNSELDRSIEEKKETDGGRIDETFSVESEEMIQGIRNEFDMGKIPKDAKKVDKEDIIPEGINVEEENTTELAGKSVGDQNGSTNGKTSADFSELSVSAWVPEPDHVGIASKISNEVPSTEEKIREQIDAMRMIVGYKAQPHPTCIDELKALYIFTGVEPPSSFKDPLDLAEVYGRLRFLMSVVGVK